jgi:hypothetical protein
MILFILVGLFLCACGTSFPPAARNPEYAGRDLRGSRLTMLPIFKSRIENEGDFLQAYRKHPRSASPSEVILSQALFEAFKPYFENVIFAFAPCLALSDSVVDDTSVVLNDYGSPAGLLPDVYYKPKESFVKKHNLSTEMVLVVSDVVTMTYAAEDANTSDALQIYANYMIWDYRLGRPVAYGRLRPFTRGNASIRRRWESVMEWGAVQVVNETSFAGKRAKAYYGFFGKGTW